MERRDPVWAYPSVGNRDHLPSHASCTRWERNDRSQLWLGCAGKLNHVGFTSALANEDRPQLTARLDALVGGSGFTGHAPGGPSRWSTDRTEHYEKLRAELVVEVTFDHVSGERFRHGTRLLRWRPDKRPEQCRMDQLNQ